MSDDLRQKSIAVMDEEASIFVAYLLMPEGLFERAMKDVDLLDDEAVAKVARKFRVPSGAVHFRYHLGQEMKRKGRAGKGQ